jgi:hypothetical protein
LRQHKDVNEGKYVYIYIYHFLGFNSRRRLGILLFTTASRTALGPTHPPIQWVPAALSLGVKRQGRESDHSPPSGTEVKEWVELYLRSPNTPSWRGAQLKHRDSFTFTLFIMNYYWSNRVIKDEEVGACDIRVRDGKWIQNFYRNIWREESIWKAYVEGSY